MSVNTYVDAIRRAANGDDTLALEALKRGWTPGQVMLKARPSPALRLADDDKAPDAWIENLPADPEEAWDLDTGSGEVLRRLFDDKSAAFWRFVAKAEDEGIDWREALPELERMGAARASVRSRSSLAACLDARRRARMTLRR